MSDKSETNFTISSGLGCGFIILAIGLLWYGGRLIAIHEGGASVECMKSGGDWVVERDSEGDIDSAHCRKGKP